MTIEGTGVEELELRQIALNMIYTFSYGGVLSIGDTQLRLYNDSAKDRRIKFVRASVGSPPLGQGIYVDIHQNGVSMFDDTRGDYPEPNALPRVYVAPEEYTGTRVFPLNEGQGSAPEVWSVGSYLVVHIDQVGDDFAGSDLTINVVVEE